MGGQTQKKWEAQRVGGPKISASIFVFFLSLGVFSCLFFSLGVLSWNFGGVFVGQDPQMARLGPGLSCETPEKTPEREKKKRKWWREREKRREIMGGLAEGGLAEGGPAVVP